MSTIEIVSIVMGAISIVLLLTVLVLLQQTYTITRRVRPQDDPRDENGA